MCQKVINDIVEVSDLRIGVISQKSKTHKTRFISKEEFAYVWKILSSQDIYTLDPINEIIGKRAVTCAILAKLPYVEGTCNKNRVTLTLKDASYT